MSEQTMGCEKKKVVILGGGYGGLMTAVTLQKKVDPSQILQGYPASIVSDAVISLRKTRFEYKIGVPVTEVEKDIRSF
jgi:hypothetical protein